MQDGVLNLCRVKLRDQQRLERTGVMKEYPQYPNGKFGTAVPRAGNASGGGQPGSIVKCKGWETDPNAYLYFITQAPVWKEICKVIGKEAWITDPGLRHAECAPAAPEGSIRRGGSLDHDQDQVRGHGGVQRARHSLRSDPVDGGTGRTSRRCARPARSSRWTIPKRGKYLSVGNPIKLSRQPDRGQTLAAARRAHRGSARGARPRRRGDRRAASPKT